MANFYIRFIKRRDQTQIAYLGLGKSFHYAPTVKEEVRDRRIVSVLRKYLDLDFELGQHVIFNRKEFEALGELLFDLIFADENLFIEFDDWYRSSIRNEDGEDTYNIYLEFDQDKEFDDLAILPWEYIHFKPKKEGLIHDEPFLAASTSKKINFYRKIPFTFVEALDEKYNEIIPPLKILLLISNPTDISIKKMDELLQYFRELKKMYPDDNHLQIKYLYQPSPGSDEFKQELNNGQLNKPETYFLKKELGDKIGPHDKTFSPDIIHYVGHGFLEDNNGMLFFAEEDKNIAGLFKKHPVSDTRFSNGIKDSRLNPKLVFLQVCNGGRIVDYINNKGTAICLLQKRIPFVIAMQNPVQEDHALRFTQTFYNNFIQGKNIGSCVSAGRYELGGQGEFNQKAFGSPVLFTFTSFPLSFNMFHQEENTDKVMEQDLEEEIIKYCNFPGCPHYGNEQRYNSTDIMCTQGHRLVSKKKEVVSFDSSPRMRRTVSADSKMDYENKSTETTHTSSRDSRTAESNTPSIGKGFTREVRKLRD